MLSSGSLLASLPVPTRTYAPGPAAAPAEASTAVVTAGAREAPPYPRRAGFVPRRPDDFGDGGAYPEIHVAQYPQDMGRPDATGGGGPTRGGKHLAVTVNADGEVNYGAIVKQGSNRNKVVYSDHKALVPKVDLLSREALAKPDQEEIDKTALETMAAMQKRVAGKTAITNPSAIPAQPGAATLIKYTPSQQGAQYNSGAKARIIKMQEMPIDPLEPPKFRHTKVPRGAGDPPVPIMHSPPRPVTQQDNINWKIPPAISNWKNAKGYTIPLDKRLAADGRGLQQTQINDKFAALSEGLFTAEAKAREAIAMRAAIQKELLLKEKGKKEAELRELAMRARMERAGAGGAPAAIPAGYGGGGMAARIDAGTAGAPMDVGFSDEEEDVDRRRRGGGPGPSSLPGPPPGGPDGREETREEREERRRRDELREERRRERERERRLESKDGAAGGTKKSKLTRDRDRDISEKVALGMAKVGGGGEVMYDQRLFNQDQGMATGFGAEDSYNTYDKPLWADRGNANLFKPTKADDEQYGGGGGGEEGGVRSDKFKADKGFKGAEATGGAGPRSKPVEFERQPEEADPFGLDQFLNEVKGGGKARGGGSALDGIGKGGSMRAAGGGSSFDDQAGGGSGRRMQFTSAGK